MWGALLPGFQSVVRPAAYASPQERVRSTKHRPRPGPPANAGLGGGRRQRVF